MKQWKKLLSIFMSGAVLIAAGILPQKNTAATEGSSDYNISKSIIENGVATGDKIKFGRYYQDAEVHPEPIKWRVLSVDGNDVFLLADKILDCKEYNEEQKGATWRTCTLRTWLNEDFYNEAFDDKEKKAVMETTVVNEDNPSYDTDGGLNTKDKVYLLSIAEACNEEYGFFPRFNQTSETRKAKPTDYAKVNNLYSNKNGNGFGYWWLRSPGYNSNYASNAEVDGYGSDFGSKVYSGGYGVRPALHINLSSYEVTYAGEVDSKGMETASESTDKISADKIREPRIKNGVTTWDCVYFGSYSQNCTFEKRQDIEWRVLAVNGDDAFLLADKVLDVKPYNENLEDVTWETCSLRKWLNNNFYNEAFNDEEKKAVIETIVFNQRNNDVDGGKDTKDKVYLLSIAEAEHADYGFDTKFGSNSETREAKSTDYAKVNNVSGNRNGNGFGYWWLRSPGSCSNNASRVGDGGGGSYGDVVSFSSNGVRPALHINLSKKPKETQKPTASPEPTKEPSPTDKPAASPEPTKQPGETEKPTESPEPTKEPSPTDKPAASPEPSKKPGETEKPTASPEPTKEPSLTDKPTASPEPTKEPSPTEKPTASPEPTKEPSPTDKPISSTEPEQTGTPAVTAQPTLPSALPSVEKQNPVKTKTPVLKKLKLSSVKRAKNSMKITGKVSVSKTSIKIKVGKKAYKKAAVKGKKFTLKLNYKLKKKTKIKIKVKKKGYKSIVKSYKVK